MNDGGNPDFRFVFSFSTAGFIYYYRGEQRFFPSWAGVDSFTANDLAFFPCNCTICDSNMGLLLCHHPPGAAPIGYLHPRHCKRRKYDPGDDPILYHAYSVCNPFLPDATRNIPNPPNGPHPDCIPRVLVIYIHPTLPRFVFHVVCALMARRSSRTYSFEDYSSFTDKWTTSGPHDVLGRIREETGVSCRSRRAYWLLEDRPSVVYYDVIDHSVGTINLPDSLFRQPGVQLRSQLGRHCDKLYFVAAKEQWRAVYAYDNEWICKRERTYAYPQLPMLSRFQDCRVQVPFWFDSGVLAIWDSRLGYSRPDRIVYLRGPQRDLCTDVLPLVATGLHPFDHFEHVGCLLFFIYAWLQFFGLDPLP